MTLPQFLNALKALRFIERDQVPELSGEQWVLFCRAPHIFLIHCSDAQAAAIWREVERATGSRPATGTTLPDDGAPGHPLRMDSTDAVDGACGISYDPTWRAFSPLRWVERPSGAYPAAAYTTGNNNIPTGRLIGDPIPPMWNRTLQQLHHRADGAQEWRDVPTVRES